jgi:hypothetical protein
MEAVPVHTAAHVPGLSVLPDLSVEPVTIGAGYSLEASSQPRAVTGGSISNWPTTSPLPARTPLNMPVPNPFFLLILDQFVSSDECLARAVVPGRRPRRDGWQRGWNRDRGIDVGALSGTRSAGRLAAGIYRLVDYALRIAFTELIGGLTSGTAFQSGQYEYLSAGHR